MSEIRCESDGNGLAGRPAAWRVVLAPWIGLLRPARTARVMERVSAGGLVLSGVFACVVIVVTAFILTLWAGTVFMEWGTPAENPQLAGLGYVGRPVTQPVMIVRAISLGEAWRAWRASETIGAPDLVPPVALVLIGLMLVAAAWIHLPTVYVGGRVIVAYALAFRACYAGVGVVVVASVMSAGGAILLVHNDLRGWASPGLGRPLGSPETVIFMHVAAWALVLVWVSWAARAVRPASPPADGPELCEGCGYALTHQPDEGRCPECGLGVAESRRPGRRPGSAWERDGGLLAWIADTVRVIVRPARFYGSLTVLGDDARARRFAQIQFAAIGIGAAEWLIWMSSQEGAPPEVLIFLPAIGLILAPLIGWGVHRTVAAVVATGWFLRGALAHPQVALKVIGYESAFLWAFCVFNGLSISSFMLMREFWGSSAVRQFGANLWGNEPKPLLLLVGNVPLCLAWVWRYRTVTAAIRWANF